MPENPNGPGRNVPPKTPRWVILFVVILILLAVTVVIAHLLGLRVNHGAGELLGNLVALKEFAVQTL